MPSRLPESIAIPRNAAEAAWTAYVKHRKGCGPCTTSTASGRTAGLCDTGWQLLQAHTRASRAEGRLRQAAADAATAQATLF